MDSSDSSNLQHLLEMDWVAHETYTRENVFHVIAKKGWLKMLCAIEGLIDEKIKLWLQKRNKEGDTCLHIAAVAHRGQQAIRIIEKLVEYGADFNERDRRTGDTVLHIAVKKGDCELATWMCQQRNINLEIENYSKHTAFQVALKNGDKEMMKILETYGATTMGVSDSEEEKESDSE
ncbi:NF-kappa-B inhibitor cactus-like [Microplitis mediator]|uniref:Uncharacterized protein n=1 Tax=Microplitis mediator bracovirus TaxID=1836595 RepID=A0A1D5APE9_9VIRU|nr:NF-kappa-B inhibitor cactus-like [Microplitis mediator]AOH69091.1 hypothetical protein A6F54_16 [Microplitis mediator bracovirus]